MTDLATPATTSTVRLRLATIAAVTLIAAGIVLRLWILATTRGANDVTIWEMITDGIRTHGFWQAYKALPYLNHPPLAAAFINWLRNVAISTGRPFYVLLKLPCVIAELGAAALLYRHWRIHAPSAALWAVAAFMFSPLSILLSSFHGNTDSVYAAMLLACALELDADRPVIAGGIWSLALQVKLIPLLAAPALLLAAKTRRAALMFVAGCCLAPVIFGIEALIGDPAFLANVFGYASQPEHWGMTGILIFAGVPGGGAYFTYGRWIMTAALIALPLVMRLRGRVTAVQSATLAMVVFAVFTPGFGVQYLAGLLPLLFAVSVPWAMALSWVGGAFVAMVYLHFVKHLRPLESEFLTRYPTPAAYVGIAAWALCVVMAAMLTLHVMGRRQRS